MFRGFGPLFARQLASWSAFLQTDHFIKMKIRAFYEIKESDPIPTSLLMPASALVALCNTALVMPLDCIKTHLAKANPEQTYLGAISEIYQKSGNSYTGFFTGIRLRFLLYLTNAIFVVNFLELLDQYKKQIRE